MSVYPTGDVPATGWSLSKDGKPRGYRRSDKVSSDTVEPRRGVADDPRIRSYGSFCITEVYGKYEIVDRLEGFGAAADYRNREFQPKNGIRWAVAPDLPLTLNGVGGAGLEKCDRL